MIQEVVNFMATVLLAKFVLNDIPHFMDAQANPPTGEKEPSFPYSPEEWKRYMTHEVSVPGYLYHTAPPEVVSSIFWDKALLPMYGSVPFSTSPYFGSLISDRGTTFVFLEETIRKKYRVLNYEEYTGKPSASQDWWEATELHVLEPVSLSDCIEALDVGEVDEKYGMGVKGRKYRDRMKRRQV